MKAIYKAVVIVVFSTCISSVKAQCLNVSAGGEALISESNFSNNEACVNISGVSISNTVLSADVQLPGQTTQSYVGYGVSVLNSSGSSLVQGNIVDKATLFKVNTSGTSNLQLKIKKLSQNSHIKHLFSIVVNKESFGLTVIHVRPQAIDENFTNSNPPTIPVCNDIYTCEYPTSANNVSYTDAAQCSEANRPPIPPVPLKKNQAMIFNLSDVLRAEKAFYSNVLNFVSLNYQGLNNPQIMMHAQAIIFTRLYNNHRTGAVYDVKSSLSPWAGNADYGNFLFGAVMSVYGFSKDETLRYSAAYQAISNYGYWGAPLGLYNYLKNSGDNPGDPAMVSRGHDYSSQVFANNLADSQSHSCIDPLTRQKIQDSMAQSGGGEGLPGGDNGNNHSRFRVTCELWQFPDGNGGTYLMYRNCNVTLIP